MTSRPLQPIEMSRKEIDRFDTLMERSYQKVYNMAFHLSRNRADAEDLAQEAYMRAYRSFKDYEGDRPFENWILRIVSRLFLDLNRSRKRRVQTVSSDAPLPNAIGDDGLFFDTPDSTNDPESVLMHRQFNEHLQKGLAMLSNEQRLLISLADIEEMPYKDIAEILGRPVGTIRSRLHRTHKLLQSKISIGMKNEAKSEIAANKPLKQIRFSRQS